MKYSVKNGHIADIKTDCLVLAVYEGKVLSQSAVDFDQKNQQILTHILAKGDLAGKIGQTLLVNALPTAHAERVLLVGCGKADEALSPRQYKNIVKKAAAALTDTAARHALFALSEVKISGRDAYWAIRFAIEALGDSLYRFEAFKSQKSPQPTLETVEFYSQGDTEEAENAVRHGSAIALGVSAAKDLANMPPNVCNPAYLAEQAKTLAKQTALFSTQVIDEAQMAELGMHAYLAVSRGSRNEAMMSIIEYKNHPDPNAKPIVLVGKGLTFDAGGISIKPAAEMDEMKYDMCGAASVYGVMKALAELKLPLNVIGVLAGCENLADGNAYRPGDILTTLKGLTVEVLNTDAEGRLVLCDALAYVERFDPECVIDIATLTGACVVALGQHNSGLVSSHDTLAQALEQAAAQSDDKAWRLPLSEEYQEQLKSNFADLANIGGRWGGAITAGAFLSNFTKAYPWAHLDIAGTAWLQGAAKGATGRPVALLTEFLLNQVK